MLFLMNYSILDLSLRGIISPRDEVLVRRLSSADVLNEGARMFREKPDLPHTDPQSAKRLAAVIVAKAPQVNAALFDVTTGASGTTVTPHVCSVSMEILASLYTEFKLDRLTRETVDRRVWRRLPRPAAA